MTQRSLESNCFSRSRYRRVSRSDVSWRVSIQRDRCDNGAKAMSWSFAGRECDAFAVRTNRSPSGPAGWDIDTGSHRVAGATDEAGENLRGPVRRSYNGAIELRQLPAAVSR